MFWTVSFTMYSQCDYSATLKQFPHNDFQKWVVGLSEHISITDVVTKCHLLLLISMKLMYVQQRENTSLMNELSLRFLIILNNLIFYYSITLLVSILTLLVSNFVYTMSYKENAPKNQLCNRGRLLLKLTWYKLKLLWYS